MYSYGPPHMTGQKQEDQLEHTFSSSVRIRDVALKTCRRRWTTGRSGERGSGISVLAARHHDDDEDSFIVVFLSVCMFLLLLLDAVISFSLLFLMSTSKSYIVVSTESSMLINPFPPFFLGTCRLSLLFLRSKALYIVIHFLVLWSTSFVHS